MKKGAIELSISTIIIIVLAVVMLILGVVFVRSMMCAGIFIGEQITDGVQNEIRDLFGSNDVGVKCIGEEGKIFKIGTGGARPIACTMIVEEETEYSIKLDSIESKTDSVANRIVEEWVQDDEWEGTVQPGKNGRTEVGALLNIPSNAPKTTLKLNFEITNEDTGAMETHTSYIEVVPIGWFKASIC